jgi:hypothetical protein
MSLLGTISRNNKKEPAGAPLPAGTAENGLSIDSVTGRVVLGQDGGAVTDPAIFLNDREIPMGGFDFSMYMIDSADPFAVLNFNNDPVNPTGRIGAVQLSGNNGAGINWQGGSAASPLINLQGFTANTVLTNSLVNDETTTAEIMFQYDDGTGNQIGLLTDFFNQVFSLGDTNDFFNGNQLLLNDATQRWHIGQATAVTNLLLNLPGAGIGLSFFDSNGTNPFLLPDPGIGGIAFMSAPDFTSQLALSDGGNGSLAQLGDVGGIGNGTMLIVDENNSRVYTAGTQELIGTNGVAYTNNAAAAVGTLNNAPAAGDPTKWIPINDNGTVRNIPAW